MIKFLFLIISTIGFCFAATAQTPLPDSLARYKNRPLDSTYVHELNRLANNYLKINPYASRKIALHSAEAAQQINFSRGYARALTVIGNSFWYEGIYDLAQNYYLLAARQYQAIRDSLGLGQAYNNLGEVYKRMAEYNQALDFLLRSIQLKRKDSATRAITLYNIGELYNLLGQYEEAEKYFQQALATALRNKDQRTVAYTYWGFALSAFKRKRPGEALDYFARAERIFRILGETRLLTQMYLDLTDAYIDLQQLRQAENYLNQARLLSSTLNVPDLMIGNLYRMARLDSARGSYQLALKHLYRYNRLKDSVFNLVKAEQMARLQIAYEAESRERENQQLRTANEKSRIQLRFQRLIIATVGTGLALTSILTWILLRQRRRILKVNKELNEKTAEIARQKRELEQQAAAVTRLNAELIALNKTLEQRIEERTRQLSVQNQKLMNYAYFNAHKLRAPVSSILGLISLLDYGLEKDTQAIIRHMRTCGEQLDSITRQISHDLESGVIE